MAAGMDGWAGLSLSLSLSLSLRHSRSPLCGRGSGGGGGGGRGSVLGMEALFDDPPVALRPLSFSHRGVAWRPYPRSHCAACGAARSWYSPRGGGAAVYERPPGASESRAKAWCGGGHWPLVERQVGGRIAGQLVRQLERIGSASPAINHCWAAAEVPAYEFHGRGAHRPAIEVLDDKLLDDILGRLVGRFDSSSQARQEVRCGLRARSLRAFASTCRRAVKS